MFALALGFCDLLNGFELFGFPLGVLVLGQGVVIVAIGLMFWFVANQNQVDEAHGATEDL